MKRFGAIITVMFAASVVAADEPGPNVTAIEMDASAGEDLRDTLNIESSVGKVTFDREVAWMKLRLDFYKDGNRVDTQSSLALDVGSLANGATAAEFAVRAIDMDYLRLGDGKPGHYRFAIRIESLPDKSTASIRTDIDKSTFRMEKTRGGSQFPARTNEAAIGNETVRETPLFCITGDYLKPTNNSVNVGWPTPEGVLKKNPGRYILIATLEYR